MKFSEALIDVRLGVSRNVVGCRARLAEISKLEMN